MTTQSRLVFSKVELFEGVSHHCVVAGVVLLDMGPKLGSAVGTEDELVLVGVETRLAGCAHRRLDQRVPALAIAAGPSQPCR